MKGRLLAPTGNIECDLVSFAADRQHSATSPVVSFSQSYQTGAGPISNNGSLYRERHARPLTEFSARRNLHKSERQSRVRSAHVRRRSIYSESRDNNDHDATSRQRAAVLFNMRRCSKTRQRTETVARSKLNVGKGLISSPSLRQYVSRAPYDGNDGEVEAMEDLQEKLKLKQEKSAGSHVEGNATSSPSEPKKSERLRIKAKRGVKKVKKCVKRNKSLLPLPTGSDFDKLVRSGAIAQHIAKKEKQRRC